MMRRIILIYIGILFQEGCKPDTCQPRANAVSPGIRRRALGHDSEPWDTTARANAVSPGIRPLTECKKQNIIRNE